jgi:hypothetical protein
MNRVLLPRLSAIMRANNSRRRPALHAAADAEF